MQVQLGVQDTTPSENLQSADVGLDVAVNTCTFSAYQ